MLPTTTIYKTKISTQDKNKSPFPHTNPYQLESGMIVGDSYARIIVGMTALLLPQRIQVTGLCKPGANLQQILMPRPKPPVSGVHCDVLIAGTNDLASVPITPPRRQHQVSASQHLADPGYLPHRHDLPLAHNINKETTLMNPFIEELAARHDIVVLDVKQHST